DRRAIRIEAALLASVERTLSPACAAEGRSAAAAGSHLETRTSIPREISALAPARPAIWRSWNHPHSFCGVGPSRPNPRAALLVQTRCVAMTSDRSSSSILAYPEDRRALVVLALALLLLVAPYVFAWGPAWALLAVPIGSVVTLSAWAIVHNHVHVRT